MAIWPTVRLMDIRDILQTDTAFYIQGANYVHNTRTARRMLERHFNMALSHQSGSVLWFRKAYTHGGSLREARPVGGLWPALAASLHRVPTACGTKAKKVKKLCARARSARALLRAQADLQRYAKASNKRWLHAKRSGCCHRGRERPPVTACWRYQTCILTWIVLALRCRLSRLSCKVLGVGAVKPRTLQFYPEPLDTSRWETRTVLTMLWTFLIVVRMEFSRISVWLKPHLGLSMGPPYAVFMATD